MTPVRCFWFLSNNFGDALNVYLVRAITGVEPILVGGADPVSKYMVCGSILAHANATMTVWGAGIGSLSERVPPTTILAVRGPLSRWRVYKAGVACPEVYGDPGFLLPKFYQPKIASERAQVGIVPHYVDHDRAVGLYAEDPDVRVISILGEPEHVIDQICACDVIVSSSLHGLVAGIAYGKPVCWAEFSDSVLGDGTKFMDLFLSCGVSVHTPLDLRSGPAVPAVELVGRARSMSPPDLSMLWEACPFRRTAD